LVNDGTVDSNTATVSIIVTASLPDSLVGYWRFDESTGTTADDSSTYGNDAAVNGGDLTTGGKEQVR